MTSGEAAELVIRTRISQPNVLRRMKNETPSFCTASCFVVALHLGFRAVRRAEVPEQSRAVRGAKVFHPTENARRHVASLGDRRPTAERNGRRVHGEGLAASDLPR